MTKRKKRKLKESNKSLFGQMYMHLTEYDFTAHTY